MIEIAIFPMKNAADGGAVLCERPDEPDFYDVLVRDEDGDVIAETEDLETYAEAVEAAEGYVLRFPDAEIAYGDSF